MTQNKLFKIARATVVLVVQLAIILVKTVLLIAGAVVRGAANGPASDDNSPRAFGDVGYRASSDGEHWNPNSRDYMPHMDPNRDR